MNSQLLRLTVVLLGAILINSGCASNSAETVSSESNSSIAEEVIEENISGEKLSRYEILSVLEPLATSIVTYTDTQYVPEGEDPNFNEIFPVMKSNFALVLDNETRWTNFVNRIDYESSDIPDLKSSIDAYQIGLDQWIERQEQGIKLWETCLAETVTDFNMMLCTIKDLDMDEEQKVLNAYLTPLKNLFQTLGVTI